MNLLRYLILLFTIANTTGVSGQSFKDRLSAISKKYSAIDRIQMTMSVKIYDDATLASPSFSIDAEIRKDNKNYRYELGMMSMLMNDNYIIVADTPSKAIVCTKRSVEGEREFESGVQSMNLDSILRFYDEPTLVSTEGTTEHYRVVQKKGPINVIELYINKEDNTLSRITYGYLQKQRVVIDFKNVDFNPVFESDIFSESKYITKQNGRWIPSPRFGGFIVSMEADAKAKRK